MARPRVFVSSTYYDLKHLRSSIENFIESLGYDAVLSEKDSIAYIPDAPLDESCYREAKSCDVFVLIIGGRYGSESSATSGDGSKTKAFFDRYESITKHEYESALERGIPTYIAIDAAVDAEYQTYLRNKDNQIINYAHVDSVNVFGLIEEIRQRKQNNPIKLFTRYSEIEDWLRDQWAGFFRELIHRLTTSQQIQDIDLKVEELSETAETLKRYLEEVVGQVSKQKVEADKIIRQENERLKEAKRDAEFLSIGYVRHLHRSHDLAISRIRKALQESETYPAFVRSLLPGHSEGCHASLRAFQETNEARDFIGLPPFDPNEFEAHRIAHRGSQLEKRRRESSIPPNESPEPKKRTTRKTRKT
ncbi:DUF4062 domain-containing protein [Luteibacter sp. SG786]|uniref:DUF4062 domain-containing protein n=1 Tax=Luteibacter sp. SG786 TaxID=2587130 RepID=UPI0014212CF0|nr:DUF4062 domain-containing protein [Luteibacter sp. SG786]NII56466.1 ElaB/YqjD/DUF883 family membrane-anchored ribosome-binding protein [Luteibacter sp. SG786]